MKKILNTLSVVRCTDIFLDGSVGKESACNAGDTMWVQSLDWEDTLEKEIATGSSIPTWEIPWTDMPAGL